MAKAPSHSTAAEAAAALYRPIVRFRAALALVARESLRSFGRHHGMDTAATLAYYGFLSLIPLLLLLIFVLSRFVLSSQAALEAIEGLGSQLFPDFGRVVVKELSTLSEQRVWSVLTMLVLLWSITPLASALRGAMARIMTPERPVNFFKSRLLDIAGALILLGLFLLVVLGKIVYATLSTRFLIQFSAWTDWLNVTGSFVVSLLALCLFYLAFAPVRLRMKDLFSGALACALLMFVLRPAFGLFLKYNPNYGFAFGSLKAIFLIIIWVYISFSVILVGAEVMANSRRRDALVLGRFLSPGTAAARTHGALLRKFNRTYDASETIFREGEPGGDMYYILAGAVQLSRGDRPLRQMQSGEYFGELSMLIDAPRTASAVAAAPHTQLLAISRENFDTILREDPSIVKEILKEMAQRLKDTNEQLGEAAGVAKIEPSNPAAPAEEAGADRQADPAGKATKRDGA